MNVTKLLLNYGRRCNFINCSTLTQKALLFLNSKAFLMAANLLQWIFL